MSVEIEIAFKEKIKNEKFQINFGVGNCVCYSRISKRKW